MTDKPRPSDPDPRPSRRRRRHGGRRPGAGAPRGNLNGLKTGRYSRQIQALKLAIRAAPRTVGVLQALDAAGDHKRELFANALHHYAELLLLGDPRTFQSKETGQIDLAQIQQLLKIDESNQAINESDTVQEASS